ncbi:hypothetical protein GU926_03590 [Nibribacter ruber]|uniref:Uncharacterized protein n=1 Tax=Nibribacter ruber TaxID=2698458 RepID=A0A6P1NU51_9BACT|nr:hypothetical protein [Nibribacter ruber]QHL86570.1 hypothetical protein GU926_03590 [Nibribacter ruber]
MKINAITVASLMAVCLFSFSACEQKPAAEKTGTTTTEDLVEGTDGGLDSMNIESDSTMSITADTLSFQ